MRHILTIGCLSLFSAGCGSSDSDDGSDTGEAVAQVPLTEALHADLIGADFGLLTATDLTVDFVVLREAGTAFEFIERNFSGWGRDEIDGRIPSLTPCIDVANSNTNTRTFSFKSCFIGSSQNRKLNATGTIVIDEFSMVVETNWSFSIGSTVDLSGTYTATWENLMFSSEADGLLDMEVNYSGNTYYGRKVVIEGASVDVQDRPDSAPHYLIPAEGNPSIGMTITWNDRSDVIGWGMALDNAGNETYTGTAWGTYTTSSGNEVTIDSGTIVEDENNNATTSIEASFTKDNTLVTVSPFSATWAAQSDSYTGQLGFYAERSSELQLEDWTSPLSLIAYTVNPMTVIADKGEFSFDGAIEFGFLTEDAKAMPQEQWLFGTCDELNVERRDTLPQSGQCDFANASAVSLQVEFKGQSDEGEHVLVDDGSGEWICRNLTTGEETRVGSVNDSPGSCP